MKNFNLYIKLSKVSLLLFTLLSSLKAFTVACPIADIKGIKEKVKLIYKMKTGTERIILFLNMKKI